MRKTFEPSPLFICAHLFRDRGTVKLEFTRLINVARGGISRWLRLYTY